jgi:hypothetical protein
MSKLSQRAPFNDWWYWSECLLKRFRTIAEIYRDNGETDRAADINVWVKQFQENCKPAVAAMQPLPKTDADKAALVQLEEAAIAASATTFRDVLFNLPFISQSVQDLTYGKWEDYQWPEEPKAEEIDENTGLPIPRKPPPKVDARLAELFWGPKQRPDEGIRSGRYKDGGLPGILYNLLAAEKTTSTRAPTDYGKVMQASATQQRVNTAKMANKMAPGKF